MKVKFKKLHKDAIIPSYAHETDAGMDMTAISREETNQYVSYDTGISVEIPPNHVGLIFPRSSVTKKDMILGNSVGVIDENYRGSISFRFKTIKDNADNSVRLAYEVGDRIGQLIIVPFPRIEPVEVDELSDTERGDGGYGSTGS